MELVFDALNGNKGLAMSVDTLVKAMNMPTGTISGSLAKLKKAGRVKNDGKGRWAIK
jgi:DNA-binding IclR family transcriptional regulator